MYDGAIKGYVEALLWVNTYTEDGEPAGIAWAEYELDDFSADDQQVIRSTVVDFIESNLDDYNEYLVRRATSDGTYNPSKGTEAEYFGHDFLLTRSGHGAGFWDRGLGELGDRLTSAAKVYGDTSVEIIDGKPVLVEN
jgi:hypothetical protein